MALVGVLGSSRSVNTGLLCLAAEHAPSLFVDCADCANPHIIFPRIAPEQLERVFVMQVDLIYSFRDAIKGLAMTANNMGARRIVISTFGRLFHYGDEAENNDILEHAWELLKDTSRTHDIIIGIHDKERKRAHKFCDEVIQWDTQSGANV